MRKDAQNETTLEVEIALWLTPLPVCRERSNIGFELSKEYFDKAVRRIKAEQAQLTLF